MKHSALVVVIAAVLGGCAPASTMGGSASPSAVEAQVTELLQESAEAWNAGDLDGFLLPYAEGAATTFVGSKGLLRSKEAIRATYQQSYFNEGTPRALLDFRDVEVRALGSENALAVGRYLLRSRDTGGPVAEGIFSLTLLRTPQGWRIIHDHSS